jgi:hypothetical protein
MDNNIVALWIDDDREYNKPFIERLNDEGITVFQKFCYEDGIEWLMNKENHAMCDAVILDVNCKTTNAEVDSSYESFRDNVYRIYGLCGKQIPWFVFTSGDGYDQGFLESIPQTVWNKDLDKRFYSKSSRRQELIDDIKKFAGDYSKTIALRNKYNGVFDFDVADESYHRDLLYILNTIETQNYTDTAIYNKMRNILTYIPKIGKEMGLFYEDIDTYKDVQKHLHLICTHDPELVPKYIVTNFYALIETVNNGSHHENESNHDGSLNVRRDASTTAIYLSRLSVFQLLTILKWLNDIRKAIECGSLIIDKIDSVLDNPLVYYEGHEAYVDFDDDLNSWMVGKCYIPQRPGVDLSIGDKVRLYNIKDNTNRQTQNKYPYFAHYDVI